MKYKLQDSDREVATVQKRGGKQTGKYRNWWNVKDKDMGEEKCINTEECEAIENIDITRCFHIFVDNRLLTLCNFILPVNHNHGNFV